METRFLIHPFEVSEEDFVACNTSNGSQLTSNYTADVINVPKLGAGIHYFISKYTYVYFTVITCFHNSVHTLNWHKQEVNNVFKI